MFFILEYYSLYLLIKFIILGIVKAEKFIKKI